tara:strand:- start:724 stop:972 length:249 start_codon:yes stop_codon:yes gene_type:complete
MKGTVTISLEDFEKLKDSNTQSEEYKSRTLYAMKEIQVFLSFLCTRSNIETHVEEFNRQSKSSRIKLKNGKAIIERIDENKV